MKCWRCNESSSPTNSITLTTFRRMCINFGFFHWLATSVATKEHHIWEDESSPVQLLISLSNERICSDGGVNLEREGDEVGWWIYLVGVPYSSVSMMAIIAYYHSHSHSIAIFVVIGCRVRGCESGCRWQADRRKSRLHVAIIWREDIHVDIILAGILTTRLYIAPRWHWTRQQLLPQLHGRVSSAS